MKNKELMLKVAKKINNSKSKSYTEEEFVEMFPKLEKAIKKEFQRIKEQGDKWHTLEDVKKEFFKEQKKILKEEKFYTNND